MSLDPPKCDYLAVVSEWSSTTPRGSLVGNAYPLVNLTTGEAVTTPLDTFPNPGAIFLPNRGSLNTWDFIFLRPRENDQYTDKDHRNCYYVPARPPLVLTNPSQADKVAIVLDHPTFNPSASTKQILNPRSNVTPCFFVKKNVTYYGPLVRTFTQLSTLEDSIDRIDWQPIGDDGIIYEFTQEELVAQKIRFVQYDHPDPYLNRVLSSPFQLIIGDLSKVTSTKAVDALPEARLIEWYLQRCPGVEITAPLLSALKNAFKWNPQDNKTIVAARLDKINKEMATNTAFLDQRDRFARLYVESTDGQRRVAEQIRQAVEKKGSEIQVEVDKRQRELAARRDELKRQLAEAEHQQQGALEKLASERQHLEQQLNETRAAVAELQQSLAGDARSLVDRMREQIPLFAALTATRQDPIGMVQVTSTATAPPPRPARRDFRPIPPVTPVGKIDSETKLVERLHANLARRGLHFARDFVANIYACLKSEALNLIIGPPGYGKSMLVTTLARILGHDNALLRLTVRRSWTEDRYILGSFDSFHDRYDPGPTGLVPRMLQAEADWHGEKTGIYVVLLDEFNLAAPEYYFSQLLQALPSDDPVREVTLYDASAGGDEFPRRIAIGPNVRFWGTINYDETTERLSPRTLDRTGMIFLGDADIKSGADADLPAMPAVAAHDLFEKFHKTPEQCPEDRWELASKVIDLLRSPDAALGPRVELSPRVLRAIKRYLANSAGVLEPRLAVDFAVQQRILPVVRGRGDEFLARMARLEEVLSAAGLARSARHMEEAIKRSEQHFGELDFLSY